MRLSKWISMLTVLALLCAMAPTAVMEEELTVVQEAPADGDFEIGEPADVLDVEGILQLPDLPAVALDPDALQTDIPSDEAVEALEAPASANDSSDFVIQNGTLVQYKGFDENVVIPSGVRVLAGEVFRDDKNMRTITIPDTVEVIGSYAFTGCVNLERVDLPDSVTDIEQGAFSYCPGLKSVRLSKNITNWGLLVFNDCPELVEVTIPRGITEIGEYAFSYCAKLKTIELPDTITRIGESTFSYCQSLVGVTIPSGVSSIESWVFNYCPSLESVIIPASVTSIERSAFEGSDKVVIRGTAGTYAERFANGMGIPFNAPSVAITGGSVDEWSNAIVYRNYTLTLTAVQTPADLATTLKWSSSDPGVATVDQNGTVKGIAPGTATITAQTANGKGRAGTIKVIVPESSRIDKFDWDNDWASFQGCRVGTSATMYIEVETPYALETGIQMPIVKCTSSAKSIISVDSVQGHTAQLTAHRAGKATITVTLADGGQGSVEMEALWQDVDRIEIEGDKTSITMHASEKYTLSTAISPDTGTDPGWKPTWSSSNTSVAKVSKSGVVTAVSAGQATITATIDSAYAYASDDIEVIVLSVAKRVTLDKTSARLTEGDKLTLKASVTPADADTKLNWTSSNPRVAKVSAKGKVTALKAGTATITVSTDNGKKATCKLTVLPAPTKVTLNKKKATIVAGAQLALKAKVTPSSAKTTLTWTSSNRKVAKVSKDGVVTALKKGTATITVKTANGKKSACKVTVPAAPTKISFAKKRYSVMVGKTLKLSAKLKPANAKTTLTWTSNNDSIATVTAKGVVKGVSKGAATITVKTANGRTAKVTVNVE